MIRIVNYKCFKAGNYFCMCKILPYKSRIIEYLHLRQTYRKTESVIARLHSVISNGVVGHFGLFMMIIE